MGTHHSKLQMSPSGDRYVTKSVKGVSAAAEEQQENVLSYLETRVHPPGGVIALANDALKTAQSTGYEGNAHLYSVDKTNLLMVVRLLRTGQDASHYLTAKMSAAQAGEMAATEGGVAGGIAEPSTWTIDVSDIETAKALYINVLTEHPELRGDLKHDLRVIGVYDLSHSSLNVIDLSFKDSLKIVSQGEVASTSGDVLEISADDVLQRTSELACYSASTLGEIGKGCASCMPSGGSVPASQYIQEYQRVMDILTSTEGETGGYQFVKLACPSIIESPNAPISMSNPRCQPIAIVAYIPDRETAETSRRFYIVAQGLIHYGVVAMLAIAGADGGDLTYGGSVRRIPPDIYAVPTVYPAEEWATVPGFTQVLDDLQGKEITCGGEIDQDKVAALVKNLLEKGYVGKKQSFQVASSDSPLTLGMADNAASETEAAQAAEV